MAQLERRKNSPQSSPRSLSQSQSQSSPAGDQLLRVEETYWSSNLSPGGRACHDHEVCPSNCASSPDGKKSVLSKVRDTAKKLRHSLSSRRRNGVEFQDPDHSHEHGQSHDLSRSQSHGLNHSLSRNYSHGQSHGLNQSLSHNYSRDQSLNLNHSLSHNYSQRQSHDLSRNNSHVPNYNHSQSRNHSHDHDHSTPSWGATMEDDCDHEDDYDPEYLGAPMYESEAAPECLKETARQHPRAEPVVCMSHRAPNMNHEAAMLGTDQPKSPDPIADKTRAAVDKLATACGLSAAAQKNNNNNNKNTSTTQTVANKLAPAYAAVSDATHHTYTAVSDATHNINANTISNTTHAVADKLAPAYAAVSGATHTGASVITNTSHAVADKLGPACTVVSDAAQQIASKIANIAVASPGAKPSQEAKAELVSEDAGNVKQGSTGSPQTYDKGVSVKEYFLSKLEPGDDERALSQAITEAISPRKSNGETGVVDLVKDAVSSFFRQEEASHHPTETSANAPVSSEVETVAALDALNSPTEVQLKRSGSIRAGRHASPIALGTSVITANPQLNRIATIHTERSSITKASPQLNRAASVHVRSTKVFTNSANSSPVVPVSSNGHEVYEEENNGRILQTN